MAKLLIVDDELDVREFAANFFRKRKVEVLLASGGQEALEILKKEAIDLVLLDIKMPEIDGLETLEHIKELDARIRVIMVTGRHPAEEGSFQKCQQLGALDYIHKPLDLAELEKVVMETLQAKNGYRL